MMNKHNTKSISVSSLNYAQALFELGIDFITLEKYLDFFSKNPDLLQVLKNPRIPQSNKFSILDKIFLGENEVLYKNFFKYLVKHKAFVNIFDILHSCKNIFAKNNHTVFATLTYVEKPTTSQLSAITDKLCKLHNYKTVKWTFKEDESILGGFIIDADNIRYDYSVKTKLESLKKKLNGGN